MAFTDNKDVNYKILMELDDSSLGKACQTNQYAKKLCQDEDFWRNRTLNVFGHVLGENREILFESFKNYQPSWGEKTWRNFYINLIDVRENKNTYDNYRNRTNENSPLYQISQLIINYMINFTDQISDKLRRGEIKFEELKDIKNKDFILYKDLIYKELYGNDVFLGKLLLSAPLSKYDFKQVLSPVMNDEDFVFKFIEKVKNEGRDKLDDLFYYFMSSRRNYYRRGVVDKLEISHELQKKYIRELLTDTHFTKISILSVLKDFTKNIDYFFINKIDADYEDLTFSIFDILLEKGATLEELDEYLKDLTVWSEKYRNMYEIFKNQYVAAESNYDEIYVDEILNANKEMSMCIIS